MWQQWHSLWHYGFAPTVQLPPQMPHPTAKMTESLHPAALSIPLPRRTVQQAQELDDASPKTPDSHGGNPDDSNSDVSSLPSNVSGQTLLSDEEDE